MMNIYLPFSHLILCIERALRKLLDTRKSINDSVEKYQRVMAVMARTKIVIRQQGVKQYILSKKCPDATSTIGHKNDVLTPLQITEALSFLHYSGQVIHKNVCPSSILITKKGTWKLAGFEFTERTNETDATDPVPCQPWSTRASKLVQPNLDYMGKAWPRAA